MDNDAKFDINDIKSVHLTLLESQIDTILNALMLYRFNQEHVADSFSPSDEERKTELAKVIYTYQEILSYKAEQLYGKDQNINRIIAKEHEQENIEISPKLSISLNATEEKILNLIKAEKYITEAELSKILNLSANCIYKNLKKLKSKELVERVGPNKNGYWKIMNLEEK